jgi:ubiquitin-hydrolase Zn-finger-containing protein
MRPVQASFGQARALNTESLYPRFDLATRHLGAGSGNILQWDGQIMGACKHLDHIQKVTPHTKGCEECLKMGDTWVHLRLCMECGHVGCCDSSKNKHATKHFHRTKHPIMRSLEPGENWGWCFVDELELDFS